MVQKNQTKNFWKTNDKLKQELFKYASNSPMRWLENAELLKLSAELLHENVEAALLKRKEAQHNHSQIIIKKIYPKRKELKDLELKLISYSNSYYLLIGYSFENLIKGVSLKNHPELTFEEIYKLWNNHKSGHGIISIGNSFLKNLSSSEIELLERLEKYVIWIGKYPVSTKQNNFVADYDKKYFDTSDKNKIDELYSKIKKMLI